MNIRRFNFLTGRDHKILTKHWKFLKLFQLLYLSTNNIAELEKITELIKVKQDIFYRNRIAFIQTWDKLVYVYINNFIFLSPGSCCLHFGMINSDYDRCTRQTRRLLMNDKYCNWIIYLFYYLWYMNLTVIKEQVANA